MQKAWWWALPLLSACATLEHGRVTDRAGDEVGVELGKADGLAAGDRIDFFDFRCEEHLWALGETEECKQVRIGGGTVVALDGERSARVRPDSGVRTWWSQHAAVALKAH